ncbi:MAG: hypothetical protein JOY77_09385 [Alphaproteobacteria bacterium]|nr:hypothetical protein [Alphaproteobacteria bacterium]
MYIRVPLATAALLICTFTGADAKKAAIDAQLFAAYTASPDTVQFDVCGATQNTSGCYGGGLMSPPFEQACAVLEGTPKYKDNVVTRAIYVLDKRTSKTDPAMLYVYTRSDTITADSVSIEVTLKKQIPLDVTGGVKSHCFMVAGESFLYAATDASTQVGVVDKKALTETPLHGSGLVTRLTADERGYVAVNFQGSFGIASPEGGFVESGGGNEYEVSTRNAWLP